MEPDRCSFYKGNLVKGKTEFVVKVDEKVLTIKDVSAYVCEECCEAYYTPEISEKIDQLMKRRDYNGNSKKQSSGQCNRFTVD